MHVIFLFGVILLLGFLFARPFSKVGIPQVVAFIILGVLLGDSVTDFVSRDILDSLSPITSVALALIGFRVGGELKLSVYGKYSKQLLLILIFEGVLAMVFVSVLVTMFTGNLALGVLLGALSSATAPAATVDVLWEYHSRGPLTNTILAIVALDDGLSLILYGFALAFANTLVSHGPFSMQFILLDPLRELGGAVLLGCAFGFLLDGGLKWIIKKEERLILALGCILMATGIAMNFGLSLILTNMIMGLYLTNVHVDRNEVLFEELKAFVPPIMILFFVLVGARMKLGTLPQLGIIGVLYVVGRTGGKWLGSYLGAKLSNAPASVRKYLGFALFSQAGVAIGLSIDIYNQFSHLGPKGAQLGQTIIDIVAATTFLVQIIGPPCVKYAISKAGEIPSK
jgi:Kef-type K+ transport system membrane component KefB